MPDQVWVADITYVRLKGRFDLCLSARDANVFTRMIRAWRAQSSNLNQSLYAHNLLKEAFCHSVPDDSSFRSRRAVSFKCLHHNARRTWRMRFPSHTEDALGRMDMLKDSSAPSKKIRRLHLNDYQSITEARDRIGHFITDVYNLKRPHSALGYLTPMEFQRQNLS